jgi:ABC-type transporter Mla subunit MlaD
MAEPLVAEVPSEYLKKEDLDGFMQKVITGLEPRIRDVVQNALDQHTAKFNQALAEAKGEIRGELEAKLNAHIEQERTQRQQEIEAVRVQIKNVGDDTAKKLGEFNTSVDHSKTAVDGMAQTVNLLNSKIEGWTTTLTANQQLYADNRKDIERLEVDARESAQAQVVLMERTDTLHRGIFGAPGHDGPKSLFAVIDDMTKQNQRGFEALELKLVPTMELARSSAARLDALERAEQQRKERWSNRWSIAKTLSKEAAKTPYFWVLMAIFAVMVVAVFRPEALATFIEFVLQLLGANP